MKCIIVLLSFLIFVDATNITRPTHPLSRTNLIEISDILYEGLGALVQNITEYSNDIMIIENSLLYLYSDISYALNNNRFIKILQEILKGDETPSIKECAQVYDLTYTAFMADNYEHIYRDVTQNLKQLRSSATAVMQVAGKIIERIDVDLENELDLCNRDYKKCNLTGDYITEVELLAPLVDDLDYFMDILFRDGLYVERIYAKSYNSQIWRRIFLPVHDCLVSAAYFRESK